jgi:hypothetical protein
MKLWWSGGGSMGYDDTDSRMVDAGPKIREHLRKAQTYATLAIIFATLSLALSIATILWRWINA